MRIVEKTLEEALIKASKEANCSIRELEYDVIQLPSAGFLGLFRKDAIIEVKIKKQIEKDLLQTIKTELTELFCNDYFEIKEIDVRALNENTINVEFICDNYECLIGKEGQKYRSLDTIINHYTNVKYKLYSRVDVLGVLLTLRDNVEKHLKDVRTRIHETGKAQTRPLEPSLLNLVYEEFLKEFSHKNIVIKDSSAGRYISIYGEFKKQ